MSSALPHLDVPHIAEKQGGYANCDGVDSMPEDGAKTDGRSYAARLDVGGLRESDGETSQESLQRNNAVRRPRTLAALREHVLSEKRIDELAQKRLERAVAHGLDNAPRLVQLHTNATFDVKLDRLPSETQERLRRLARHEAEEFLAKKEKQAKATRVAKDRTKKIQIKLFEWHEQKEAIRRTEAARQEEEKNAQEQEEQEREERYRRGLNARRLRHALAAISEADEASYKAKADSEAELVARRRERLKWRRHDKELKEGLRRWYQERDSRGLAAAAAIAACPG
eukprot:TRINITY_DN56377_c0_g1_i1.p1 TRINITY_DN56377_c0_g1~~TRINITY_DN56377_c0_g1_i1.p1  ORF type:complete len:284 (+),score=48.08 TRINITY_DN56377_c0_g1_i1:43-894(+)